MADFPIRSEAAFYAHWHKIMVDPANILRTILYEGQVAGNMVSFIMEGKREVGYWLGREYWGKGIASAALKLFLKKVTERPLYGIHREIKPRLRTGTAEMRFELLERTDKELILLPEIITASVKIVIINRLCLR